MPRSISISTRPAQTTPSIAFPTRQLFVLALCRICEPIAFMSIFPYVYYMVLSFEITTDSHRIAVYVGLITSAFAFAEFSSGVIWGRISDRVGRKPVLLAGLAGTAISMLAFGFADSLPKALLARALGGLLNGNMGVLQTTVAELVTVKEHQPRAFSIMPFVWCLGSVLGPAMGGALAQPATHFPSLFHAGSLFDNYPFLLPNLVCTVVLVCGVTVGFLFLEETHEEKKLCHDSGIEVGNWLLRRLHLCRATPQAAEFSGEKMPYITVHQTQSFMDDETLPEYSLADDAGLPGYRTTEGTPRQSSSRSPSPYPRQNHCFVSGGSNKIGSGKAFSTQVILTIAAFGMLAYHSISYDQLMPIFLSEPVSHGRTSLPVYFTGGFGYSSKRIGFMLAVQGVYSMIAQLFIFPWIVRKLGTLRTLRVALLLWPFLYVVVPYMVLLPTSLQAPTIYAALLLKMTFHVLAFPSIAILIANAAPSKTVLGLINGAAASTASLARAFGPLITGAFHSWGIALGITGLAWWICGVVCLLGTIESFWMQETSNAGRGSSDLDEETAGSREGLLDPDAIDAAISATEEDIDQCYADVPRDSDSKTFAGLEKTGQDPR